ncbi:MAG: hypothetical protein Q8Q40_12225 [Methylococcaceae bacterium]|nr:hypothetical protein [Methylococcaceae bacterium]MDP3904727.1 hypothetical protein [Methylococcaceae bacterium]
MATKKESDAAKILQQKLSAIAKAKEIELKAWQLANPEKFKLQQEAEALKRQKEAVQFANLMRAGVKGTRKDSEKIQIEQSLNNTPTTQTWNSWVINSKQSAIKSLEKTNTPPKGYQPKKWGTSKYCPYK